MYYVYEFFLYKSWQVLGANIPRSRKSPGRQRHTDPFGRKSSKKSVIVWKYILSFLLSIKGHLIPF